MVEATRMTVESDEEIAVFLIGMRVNNPLRADQWLPVMFAMPRMLMHLDKHPEAGLLGYEQWLGRRPMLVSYWRSAEHLQRFAADPDAPHLEPWRRFMKRVQRKTAVGVWHETYISKPSQREVVYVNMPPFGLGRALGGTPIGAGMRTAQQRLSRGERG